MGIGLPLAHLHVVCSAFAIPGLQMLSKQKSDSKIWYFLVIWGYWEFTADKLHSTLLPVSDWYQGSRINDTTFYCPVEYTRGFSLVTSMSRSLIPDGCKRKPLKFLCALGDA